MLHPLAGARLRVFLRQALFTGGFDRRTRLQRAVAWGAQAARLLPTAVETVRYRAAIRRQPLEKPPVFLIGHWRSGTTHLHNLMSRDLRFGYLTFAETAMPLNMLGAEVRFARRLISDALPATRGYDNVKLSLDEPQEEEMGLTNLNPIGYFNVYYFPADMVEHSDRALFFEGTTSAERARFRDDYEFLIRKLSLVKEGRQLLFKNPASTTRMPMILDMFPEAKFVHIVRNPWPVFSSNCRKFPRLYNAFAWQPFHDVDVASYTLETYGKFMRRYLEDRTRLQLGKDQLVETTYEHITADPIGELGRIYDQLGLDSPADGLSRIAEYVESVKDYQPNVHTVEADHAARIREDWEFAFDAWGYARDPPGEIEILG